MSFKPDKFFPEIKEMLYYPYYTQDPQMLKGFKGSSSLKFHLRRIVNYTRANVFNKNKTARENELLQSAWFYTSTDNNIKVVDPLYQRLHEKKVYVSVSGEKGEKQSGKIIFLNSNTGYWQALKALFITIAFAFHSKRGWLLMSHCYHALVVQYKCREILKKYKPKAIFFTNDHMVKPRAMLVAARKQEIPTVYIQHACVSPSFPPLGFDVSFLDGQDSEDKYKVLEGEKFKVVKTGIIIYDKYKKNRNYSPAINRIGICIGLLDDEKLIFDLISFLKSRFPEQIISLRFHPRYHLHESILNNLEGIQYSIPGENAFDFFARQDLNIADNSSVHLEAVLMNVISVQFPFSKDATDTDVYWFKKNKLVLEANQLPEVEAIVSQYKYNRPSDWYLRARYYVQNLDDHENALESALKCLQKEGIISA